ncbi:MAG TPA: ATP-binding protein [Actinomycetota bacterium]|nr:ATP-binding protein [Actinomycetota bacterium]
MKRADVRVWALVILVGAAAATLLATLGLDTPAYASAPQLSWLVVAGLFLICEIFVINFPFRREALTLSLSEIPLVIGLFFLSPLELVGAQILGSAIALTAHRRQEAKKWLYNLAHFAIGATVASELFHAIARPGTSLTGSEVLAAVIATAVAMLSSIALVMLAIRVAGGNISSATVVRYLVVGAVGGVTNTSLGLMSVVLLRIDPHLVWLLGVPATTIFLAYRGYSSHRRQNEALTDLSEATRTVQRAVEVEPAMRTVLERARAIFFADVAAITFFPIERDEPAFEVRLGPEGESETLEVVTLDPTEGVWARVASEGRAILLAKPIENARLRAHFSARGLKDAMVAPLWGKDGAIGTMLVGNRAGNFETFRADDLSFFETFVNHIGLTLENLRLVARLQQSVGSLTERHKMKDEFLSMFSHEMRNPLMSILTNIDVLRDEGIDPNERKRHVDIMAGQAEQMRSLLEDLLMDARLSGGIVEPVFARVPVSNLIDRVITSCGPMLQRHVVATKIEEPLPEILSDYDLLHRILCNLVANAAKNSPAASMITIGSRREGDDVTIFVADEGAGIPAEHHERIFERFTRFDRSPGRVGGGLGLGLSICRRLAEALGARVQLVHSAPGAGSEFAIQIPIRRRDAVRDDDRAGNVVPLDALRRNIG